MSYKCLVLDFDGTIADTFEQAYHIVNELADERKFRKLAREEIGTAQDMSLTQFLKFLGIPKRRLPGLLLAGRSKLAKIADQIQPVSGMDAFLHAVRPHVDTLGILTSNSAENVETFAGVRGLDIFDFVSSVPKLTGKSRHLKAIMLTYSVTADEILYVGDETRDVAAAKKAGVDVAAVTWGFNSAKSLAALHPEYLIKSPTELLSICFPEPRHIAVHKSEE